MLIAAFRGWNDGGQGATLAAGYLARRLECGEIRGHRSGGLRRLPGEQAARLARRRTDAKDRLARERLLPRSHPGYRAGRGAAAGRRAEPRWKTFSKLVLDLARDLEVELVITLGSLLADVPHTRAAPVTGAASDPELVQSLGLQHSRYEGPTGIVGVLQDACRSEGVPAASLWAAVPQRLARAQPAGRPCALRPARAAALGPDRHRRARRGRGGLCRAGHGGGLDRRGDRGVRRRARAPDRRARLEEHETLPSGDTSPQSYAFLRDATPKRRRRRTRLEQAA